LPLDLLVANAEPYSRRSVLMGIIASIFGRASADPGAH
jgi:hypothetical protein